MTAEIEHRTIHFAVTSHGLGHLTRALALIRAIHESRQSWHFIISSTISPKWIRNQLEFDVICRSFAYEPGAAQKNCFEVDVSESLEAYREFQSRYESIFAAEIRFLRQHRVSAVICDIPALPVAAAGSLGLPAIGISNFTWDWIIEPWCEGDDLELVDMMRTGYSAGTYHFCLPFGPASSIFPGYERAPLVSRRAHKPPDVVRQQLELGDAPLALICPGGWDADDWPIIRATSGRFSLVTVNDLPISSESFCRKLGHTLPYGLTIPDLVAASDVVLGKPGYGLASECLAHKIPFAMIDRPDFRETPILISEMKKMARCSTLSIDQFFSGNWEYFLERALVGGSDWAGIRPDATNILASRVVRLIEDSW